MARPTTTPEDKSLLSAEMVAKVLMVNVSRVYQMGREGIIPKEENGKYRLVPAVQGYINFLKGGYEDEDLISLSKEKARLTKAQRERAEFELAVAKAKYIKASEVEEEMAAMAKTVVGVLETLPDVAERDCNLLPDQVNYMEIIINNLREEIYNRLIIDNKPNEIIAIQEADDIDEQSSTTEIL